VEKLSGTEEGRSGHGARPAPLPSKRMEDTQQAWRKRDIGGLPGTERPAPAKPGRTTLPGTGPNLPLRPKAVRRRKRKVKKVPDERESGQQAMEERNEPGINLLPG
jgi:hypothetical protein